MLPIRKNLILQVFKFVFCTPLKCIVKLRVWCKCGRSSVSKLDDRGDCGHSDIHIFSETQFFELRIPRNRYFHRKHKMSF